MRVPLILTNPVGHPFGAMSFADNRRAWFDMLAGVNSAKRSRPARRRKANRAARKARQLCRRG